MYGSKKKPRNVPDPDPEESMSDESESGTYHGQKEVQATFEGRNLEGIDFHGIKTLLQQLFLKAHVDLSQIGDLLIDQGGIGAVLKQACSDSDDEESCDMVEDSDVFGVTSVLNLAAHKDAACVKQFFSLLDTLSTQHAPESTREQIKQILNKHKNIGFLINERFVNIPAKISVIMLNSLYNEIEEIKKKNPSYNFDYYIMICKTCKPKNKQDEVIYTNDEEEIFVAESEVNFDFDVSKETDTSLTGKWLTEDKQVVQFRKVLLFKANKLRSIIDQITALVGP